MRVSVSGVPHRSSIIVLHITVSIEGERVLSDLGLESTRCMV